MRRIDDPSPSLQASSRVPGDGEDRAAISAPHADRARPPSDGLPNPARALAFATLAAGVAMTVIDGAIANVALPTIAADLAVSPARAIWVVNAYQVAVTVALLPLASLADIVGYRRVWIPGLALFTVASLACGMSGSLLTLTLARLAQGLGAAGVMSVNIAYVRFIYPKTHLGIGIGNTAVVVAVCAAAGPTVAAAILAVAPWRWLFFINVPIGIVAFALAMSMLPATPRLKQKLDLVSVLLNAVTFGSLIIGVDALGSPDGQTGLIEIGVALVAGALLTWRQFGLALPVLPVDLLRRPVFALSMASSITSFCAQSLALIALPFLFEGAFGRSPAATGLLMTAMPLSTALIAPFAGRLADRFAPGLLGSVGLVINAAGLVAAATMPAAPATIDIVWRLAVCGFGFGFFQSPNNRAIIGSAPPGRSGGASGLQSTGRLVGQSLGAAIMAVTFARHAPEPTQLALSIAAALCLVGALASGLRRVD